MLANFLQLIAPQKRFYSDGRELKKVHATRLRGRYSRFEQWMIIGWLLIGIKCLAMWWLIETYPIPIHPMWLVGPTIMFGLLATAVYIWRD